MKGELFIAIQSVIPTRTMIGNPRFYPVRSRVNVCMDRKFIGFKRSAGTSR